MFKKTKETDSRIEHLEQKLQALNERVGLASGNFKVLQTSIEGLRSDLHRNKEEVRALKQHIDTLCSALSAALK